MTTLLNSDVVRTSNILTVYEATGKVANKQVCLVWPLVGRYSVYFLIKLIKIYIFLFIKVAFLWLMKKAQWNLYAWHLNFWRKVCSYFSTMIKTSYKFSIFYSDGLLVRYSVVGDLDKHGLLFDVRLLKATKIHDQILS